MAGILVYALHDDEGNFNKNSLGAISEAAKLAGQIGGDDRAKAIQLSMEYDPQPPFDSGHLSKASAATKAAATALLSRDSAKPANLKATTMIAWEQALSAVRSRRRKRQPDLAAVSPKA